MIILRASIDGSGAFAHWTTKTNPRPSQKGPCLCHDSSYIRDSAHFVRHSRRGHAAEDGNTNQVIFAVGFIASSYNIGLKRGHCLCTSNQLFTPENQGDPSTPLELSTLPLDRCSIVGQYRVSPLESRGSAQDVKGSVQPHNNCRC